MKMTHDGKQERASVSMHVICRGIGLMLSLAALIVGLSIAGFLASVAMVNWFFPETEGWGFFLLMAQVGWVAGILLGVSYRNTLWIKLVSVLAGCLTVVFLTFLCIHLSGEEPGMKAGLGRLIASGLLIFYLILSAVSLAVSALIAVILTAHDIRLENRRECPSATKTSG